MHVLIGIALKSLLVAAMTLGLLNLFKHRSAAERSAVAHIGLVALLIMAVVPVVLPHWNVEAPALLGQSVEVPAVQTAGPVVSLPPTSPASSVAPTATRIAAEVAQPKTSLSASAAATVLYAIPAAILLFLTALALGRLITLRARADVLVDGHWLSALARAQRRMGFKHGTALLTSDDLASPISWGLMRPVILLNTRAVEASGEAEAIIAHELAHVARMDWVKLLLARVATALFWFNPLVWILAREAHQLREEAADDAVLAANIADTDYAQLLVGVARHECPGLLLGAHGVAPSKSSLARRVARVLDGKSVRGPAARSFAMGVFTGAMLVAAPLAAITLTPSTGAKSSNASRIQTASAPSNHYEPYYAGTPDVPTDLPSIIADGVTTAVGAVTPPSPVEAQRQARAAAIAATVATATRARDVAVAQAAEATARVRAAAQARALDQGDVDQIIELKTSGITADYVNAMRAAAPRLRNLQPTDFAGMKAIGVTPEFARGLAAAFPNIGSEELTEARAVGLTGDYARAMVAAGVRPDLDDFVQLRAVGVPASYVVSLRKTGRTIRDADQVVQMWTVGVKPGDLKVVAPRVPRPPRTSPPGIPLPDWDPPDSDD